MTNLTNIKTPKTQFAYLNIFSTVSLIVWIVIIVLSFTWNYINEHDQTLELAKKEALTNLNKDMAMRYWAIEHGGVYVPVSGQTLPSPYLKHVSEKNIITLSGKKLTLMNPAYMIRQVMGKYDKLYDVKGRIVSLKPLNSGNLPDAWELEALKEFEKGVKEVSGIVSLSGKPYLRLIRPLITKKECLKCHQHQGYKVGDVRGGIGVSMPMSPYYKMEKDAIYRISIFHILFGFLGITAIILIAVQSKKGIVISESANEKIYQVNTELERRVKERTVELETINQKLNDKIREHEQTEVVLQKKSHDFAERVKELNCLYGISELIEKS